MKKVIRLTESDLHSIVKQSVNNTGISQKSSPENGSFRFAGAKLLINNEKTNANNFMRNN